MNRTEMVYFSKTLLMPQINLLKPVMTMSNEAHQI